MGKKRRDGRAAKRGNNSSSSNVAARNSHGGSLQRTARWSRHCQYSDGTLAYEGEVQDGQPHGKGKMKLMNGEVYEGEWVEGKEHGRGTLTFSSGEIYEGEFANGQMQGWGTLAWPSGQVYGGQWEDGEKHGKGTFRWTDGRVYEGQFANGQVQGWGTKTFPSGNVYEGQWVDEKPNGRGTMRYPSGEIYEGIWRDGGLAKEDMTNHSPPGCSATGESSLPNSGSQDDDTAKAGGKPFEGSKLRSRRSQKNRLETVKQTCEHCGVDDYHYKLRACSGCNLALYCSAACQKAASRSHRRICDIASMLPSRDSVQLTLEYDKDKLVDLDAGLRYGTKYMDSLKHLKIFLDEMAEKDTAKLSAKYLRSLFRSKKGALESVSWVPSGDIDIPGITENGYDVWKELECLKHLRLRCMKFDDVQHHSRHH